MIGMNYYNEIDPYAAQWLRNLIAAGHITAGDVDERSIVDVSPDDLRAYRQCHFFAGIGGWSYALRLAGWPDDRLVWTGSCPCQPFSAAGAGKAADDERHLWPRWFSLIRECRPAIVFGEQVEAAIGWGWLDVVFSDLEAEGYACGASVLPACSVGAPHIRQRLWFVADDDERGRQIVGTARIHEDGQSGDDVAGCGADDELADAGGVRWGSRRTDGPAEEAGERESGDVAGCGLGDADGAGLQARESVSLSRGSGRAAIATGLDGWFDCEWLSCTDGKARPVEPGTFPLAHGISGRVGRLRAYGNAIVPQVAAEFIRACARSQ